MRRYIQTIFHLRNIHSAEMADEGNPNNNNPGVLNYISECIQDFFYILYLFLYGTYAVVLQLPWGYLSYFLSPCGLYNKSLEDEIILIVCNNADLSTSLISKLSTAKVKKVVVWSENDDNPNETKVNFEDKASLDEAMNKLIEAEASPTILINALDEVVSGRVLEMSVSDIEKMAEVVLASHFWLVQKLLPSMIEKNKGVVVLIGCPPRPSSSWALLKECVPSIGMRAGMMGWVESLRSEVKIHMVCSKIQFTTVIPSLQTRLPVASGGPFLALKSANVSEGDIAEGIVDGIRRRRDRVYVPGSFRVSLLLDNILPERFIQKMQTFFINEEDKPQP